MSYYKYLRPFKQDFVPTFVKRKYQQFYKLVDVYLKFIEEKNGLDWFKTLSVEKLNSIYQNICNFNLLIQIDTLPIDNKDLFYTYMQDYCSNVLFENNIFRYDIENVRDLAKFITNINCEKGTWKSFNTFLSITKEHFILGTEISNETDFYYTNSFVTTDVPAWSAIPDDTTVITELPRYYVNDDIDISGDLTIEKNTIDYTQKGYYPFLYQIASKADAFRIGQFSKQFLENFNPAGFHCEILVEYDEMNCDNYIDCHDYSKFEYLIETNE